MNEAIESKGGAVIGGLVAGAGSGALLSLGEHWNSAIVLCAAATPVILSGLDALKKKSEDALFFKHAKTGFASVFAAAALTHAAIDQPWKDWGKEAQTELTNAAPQAYNKGVNDIFDPLGR